MRTNIILLINFCLISIINAYVLRGKIESETPWTAEDIRTTVLTLRHVPESLSQLQEQEDDILPLDDNEKSTIETSIKPSSVVATSFLSDDGSFLFTNITSGSYLLFSSSSLQAITPAFIKIEIANGKIHSYAVLPGHSWDDNGPSIPYPIILKSTMSINYLIDRPQFDPKQIIKNPMIMMSLVALLFVFGLPILQKNLDPETLLAMQEEQNKRFESNPLINAASNKIAPQQKIISNEPSSSARAAQTSTQKVNKKRRA